MRLLPSIAGLLGLCVAFTISASSSYAVIDEAISAARLSGTVASRAEAVSGAAPVLDPPAPMALLAGTTLDQILRATDPNGDPLSFSKSYGPSYMTVTTTDPGHGLALGNVHLAPLLIDLGETSGGILVSDGLLADQGSIDIAVMSPLEYVQVIYRVDLETFAVGDPPPVGIAPDRPRVLDGNLIATVENSETVSGVTLSTGNFLRLGETPGEAPDLQFDRGIAINTGTAHVSMDLLFETLENYRVYFRNGRGSGIPAPASQAVADIQALSSGQLRFRSIGGVSVWSYTPGTVIHLDTYFDMDGNTWNAFVNGRQIVFDQSCIDSPLGLVAVGFEFSGWDANGDFDGVLQLDNVHFEKLLLPVSLDLDPKVINLRSHAPWVTAYIEPLGFDPAQIDLSSVHLAGSVPAEAKFAVVGDYDLDRAADMMVKFKRAALDPLLMLGVNRLELTGVLLTGEMFIGSDEVRVIDPPEHQEIATVAPNPLNPSGTLTLRIARQGPVTVRLYDLRGRMVRTLLETAILPAGSHEVAIDGNGDRGQELASGVYFYRVETVDGALTGRITIVR